MKLYLNSTSPFARFVLISALINNIHNLELVWVDPWLNPSELTKYNPFSRVPTLVVGNDCIMESSLITMYFQEESNKIYKNNGIEDFKIYGIAQSLMEIAFKCVSIERFCREDREYYLINRYKLAIKDGLHYIEHNLCLSLDTSLNISLICLAVAVDYVYFRLHDSLLECNTPILFEWLEKYQKYSVFIETNPNNLQNEPDYQYLLGAISRTAQINRDM